MLSNQSHLHNHRSTFFHPSNYKTTPQYIKQITNKSFNWCHFDVILDHIHTNIWKLWRWKLEVLIIRAIRARIIHSPLSNGREELSVEIRGWSWRLLTARFRGRNRRSSRLLLATAGSLGKLHGCVLHFSANLVQYDQEITHDQEQTQPFILPGIAVKVISSAFHQRHYPLLLLHHPHHLLPRAHHEPLHAALELAVFLQVLHVLVKKILRLHQRVPQLRHRRGQRVAVYQRRLLHVREFLAEARHHLEAHAAVVFLGVLASLVGVVAGVDAGDAPAGSFGARSADSLRADDLLDDEVQECGLAVCSLDVGEFEEGVEPERLRAAAVRSVVHTVAGFQNCF